MLTGVSTLAFFVLLSEIMTEITTAIQYWSPLLRCSIHCTRHASLADCEALTTTHLQDVDVSYVIHSPTTTGAIKSYFPDIIVHFTGTYSARRPVSPVFGHYPDSADGCVRVEVQIQPRRISLRCCLDDMFLFLSRV